MIKEVQMFTVICDECGKDANEGSEYSCWSDKSWAEESAMESCWKKDGEKHYCDNCWYYDDYDNLIFKTKP